MIIPNGLEELAGYVEIGKSVFFFTAGWYGDCRFVKPQMLGIENNFSDWQFTEVNRDKYINVAAEWSIFGIPSFVVIQDKKELGRLVGRDHKTKQEIESFLKNVTKG